MIEQDTRGLILESLRNKRENLIKESEAIPEKVEGMGDGVSEATSLSAAQIKWLFANGAATDVGGKVVVDWEKAKKAGWNPTNGE